MMLGARGDGQGVGGMLMVVMRPALRAMARMAGAVRKGEKL